MSLPFLVDANNLLIVILIAIAILFFLWVLYFSKHKNVLNREKYLVGSFIVVMLIIIAYIVGHNQFLSNHFNGSAVFNVVTFIGIGVTFLGVYIAYEQSKFINDRIYGYDEFYDKILSLIKEIDDNKNSDEIILQFSGQTLIPGQLSYSNKEKIESYRGKIAALSQIGQMKKKMEFITLNEDLTKIAYNEVKNERVNGLTKRSIDKALEDLNTLKGNVEKQTIKIKDENMKGIIENYYISNGRTAIYATSLHYLEFSANSKNKNFKKLGIELIGFRTTDRTIVNAFKDKFVKIKEAIENKNKENDVNNMKNLCIHQKRICENINNFK
jgi:uncharacterized membrane protein (DUF106 family)